MYGATNMVKRGLAFGLDPLRRGARVFALPPGRRAKRRRGVRMLMIPALLWVFTQLVMSGFILQPTQVLAGGLRTITICTGTELATITVDADGQPVKDAPAKRVACPWCAQFGGIGLLPAPDPAPLAAACGRSHKIALPQGLVSAATAPFFHYVTRAPPLSTSL